MVEVSNSTKGQQPQLITTAHTLFPSNVNSAGLRDSCTTDRAIKPSFSKARLDQCLGTLAYNVGVGCHLFEVS